MQCPNGDGDLISHTTHGENNLTVSYSTCPACHGYWMGSFAANFITPPPGDSASGTVPAPAPACPVCSKRLRRADGDNIPDTVTVYSCPEGHGYFFPQGQLAAFKKAQKSKIEYHKLWNLPLPNVSSVLLTAVLVLILTGGLVVSVREIQHQQQTTSQAQDLISSQHAYPIAAARDVLVTAETRAETVLTVHIPTLNGFEGELRSSDMRTHTLTVSGVQPGSYDYYFTVTIGGKEIRSQTSTFIMPQ